MSLFSLVSDFTRRYVAAAGYICLATSALGCDVDNYADPIYFESQLEIERTAWSNKCATPCDKDSALDICASAPDTGTCSLYNMQFARDCVRGLEQATRQSVCATDSGLLMNLTELCSSVYSSCGESTSTTGAQDDE